MYRFGPFQVDARAHELRRSGVRVKVQEQPFVVLLKLLERPGELDTREELRSAIWPADTFVDFETGLNSVVKRLREVLGFRGSPPLHRDRAEAGLSIHCAGRVYRWGACGNRRFSKKKAHFGRGEMDCRSGNSAGS